VSNHALGAYLVWLMHGWIGPHWAVYVESHLAVCCSEGNVLLCVTVESAKKLCGD
jgi:hypothetical protein